MRLSTKTLISATVLAMGTASSAPPFLNGTDPMSASVDLNHFPLPPPVQQSPRSSHADSSCSRLTEWAFQDNGAHSPARQCEPAFSLNTSLSSSSSPSTFNMSSCLTLVNDDIQPQADKYGYWDIYYSCDDSQALLPSVLYGPKEGCVFGIRGVEGDRMRDVAMAPADVVGFVRAAVAFAEGPGNGGDVVEGRTRCNGTGKDSDPDAEGQTIVWWVGSDGGGGARGRLTGLGWLMVSVWVGMTGLWLLMPL